MKNLVLFFLLFLQITSHAAHKTALDSGGPGDRILYLKIPFIHAGLNASLIGSSHSLIQKKYTLEGIGSGLWYFPGGKYSYQLDADFRLSTGEYLAPNAILKNGDFVFDSTFLGYGYFSPQVSFAINYTLKDLDHFKVYTFMNINLQLTKWLLRKATVPSGGTLVGGTPYQGTEYDAVYKVRLQKDHLPKNFRAGIAWAGKENIIVARLYTEASPPASFTYTAEPISSDPKEARTFHAKSKWDFSFGFSLEFNTVLHDFKP